VAGITANRGSFDKLKMSGEFFESVLAAFLGEDCLSDVASSAAANTELRATGSNTNHPVDPSFVGAH